MSLSAPLVTIVAQPATVTTIPIDDVDNRLLQAERALAALNINMSAMDVRVTAMETGGTPGGPVTVTITAAQETALAGATRGTLVRLQGPAQSFFAVAQ